MGDVRNIKANSRYYIEKRATTDITPGQKYNGWAGRGGGPRARAFSAGDCAQYVHTYRRVSVPLSEVSTATCMYVGFCAPWVPHTFRFFVGTYVCRAYQPWVRRSLFFVDSRQKQPFHTAQRPTKHQTGRRPQLTAGLRRRTTR